MDREELAKLQKLAMPALCHAELVDLARSTTPSKAFEMASSRWPRRQARAVRSLAMVRRDFGQEAFEAFLIAMERVRSVGSETEQAQEKRQMEDRLKSALARLSDPAKKLGLMVKNGLLAEATTYVHELVTTLTPSFYWHSDVNHREIFTSAPDRNSPIDLVKVGFHPADTDLTHSRLNIDQDSVFSLDLRGVIHSLQWSEVETWRFVEAVLRRMVDYPISLNYFSWVIEGMQRVVRYFLSPRNELALRAERWMLLYRFRDGRLFELRQRALPMPIERTTSSREMTNYEIRHELDPIVDRMHELGMSEGEVRTEFLDWMRQRVSAGCDPQFMLAVAGAKCFKYNDPEPGQLLRAEYLQFMWQRLVQYDWVSQFAALGEVGLWKVSQTDDGDEKFFRRELTELLADGKAGQVFQLLVLLGSSLDVYPREIEREKDDVERAKKMMETLAASAFPMTIAAEQYGVAAALAQYFQCYDEQQLQAEANQSVVDEVAAIAGDEVRTAPSYLSELIDTGFGEPDEDDLDYEQKLLAAKEVEAKFVAIRAKRDAKFNELLTARQAEIREASSLANALEQPIRLDWMTFILPPHLPK